MQLNEENFEKAFFKAIITDENLMAVLHTKCKKEIFKQPYFQAVYDFYRGYYQDYSKLPSNEELKLFIKSNGLLAELKKAYEETLNVNVANIDRDIFIKSCETFLKKRLSFLKLNDIIENMNNKPLDPVQIMEDFSSISSISVFQEEGFHLYNDVEKYIKVTKETIARIPTGFDELDEEIGGGVFSDGKFLGVVVAPTNVGKSIFLGNIAVNAAKMGKSVLLISLEMSETVYASRLYSALYDMNINSLELFTDELREKVKNQRYGDILVKEFPPATMTVEDIDAYISNLYKNGKKFDMICVDYLTLINAGYVSNSNEAGKKICQKLRALTYKYNIPLWTAAQLNRDGMKENNPSIVYLAESIAIGSESDLILALNRQDGDEETGTMRLHILKSRLGRRDKMIPLVFNPEKLRFENYNDGVTPLITVNTESFLTS